MVVDHALVRGAVEETLRWAGPVGTSTRQTTRATEVGGVGLGAGALIGAVLSSIAKTQETGVAQLTCYAGTAGAVIYDEGTLSSCENLAPIGNLRDHDWNFQGLWLSDAMKARRKQAAQGCFCTHESNCYYPSLPFNPKHLIQIKKLEREMKKARRELEKQVEPEPEGLRARA